MKQLDLAGHHGLLVRPTGARALFVLAHGAGAGMRHVFMEQLATALAGQGIATLRWEFLYMTRGSPRVDAAAVSEASVRAVWDASKRIARGLPRFAGGKSYGGRMTSGAHAKEPLVECRGLIFVGFPLHPPNKPGSQRADHLPAAAGPLLFLQGTRDDLADLALLRPVVAKLGRRATLHVIDGADHGFTRKPDIPELAQSIAAWIDTTLAHP